MLVEHHIKRTRYAHQVSVMGLYLLRQGHTTTILLVYKAHLSLWRCALQDTELTTQCSCFWSTVMNLELLMCRSIRSLHEGDIPLCIQVCDELCSWFHAMDHTNHACWLPVHVRDMVQLPHKHSQLYTEFLKKTLCCAEVRPQVQSH